jgi:hypothetical protein
LSADSEQRSLTVQGMYHLFLGNTSYTLLLAITAIVVGRILSPGANPQTLFITEFAKSFSDLDFILNRHLLIRFDAVVAVLR